MSDTHAPYAFASPDAARKSAAARVCCAVCRCESRSRVCLSLWSRSLMRYFVESGGPLLPRRCLRWLLMAPGRSPWTERLSLVASGTHSLDASEPLSLVGSGSPAHPPASTTALIHARACTAADGVPDPADRCGIARRPPPRIARPRRLRPGRYERPGALLFVREAAQLPRRPLPAAHRVAHVFFPPGRRARPAREPTFLAEEASDE